MFLPHLYVFRVPTTGDWSSLDHTPPLAQSLYQREWGILIGQASGTLLPEGRGWSGEQDTVSFTPRCLRVQEVLPKGITGVTNKEKEMCYQDKLSHCPVIKDGFPCLLYFPQPVLLHASSLSACSFCLFLRSCFLEALSSC